VTDVHSRRPPRREAGPPPPDSPPMPAMVEAPIYLTSAVSADRQGLPFTLSRCKTGTRNSDGCGRERRRGCWLRMPATNDGCAWSRRRRQGGGLDRSPPARLSAIGGLAKPTHADALASPQRCTAAPKAGAGSRAPDRSACRCGRRRRPPPASALHSTRAPGCRIPRVRAAVGLRPGQHACSPLPIGSRMPHKHILSRVWLSRLSRESSASLAALLLRTLVEVARHAPGIRGRAGLDPR
jgi:hypothetical protein